MEEFIQIKKKNFFLPARTFTSREIIEPNWFLAKHAYTCACTSWR